MRLKQYPFHLLLLTGFALLLTTFFLDSKATIDIHIHDTYFVFAQRQVYYIFVVVVWFLWLLYLLTRKVLYSTAFIRMHVIVTLVTIFLLLLLLNTGGNIFNAKPKRFFDYNDWNTFNRYQRATSWFNYVLLFLLVGQITFIVNLVVGIVKRLK